jgi:hypothetical protein
MNSAIDIHRLHFAFTITFHYLFPQLTMGLALLIVILKAIALFKRDELYNNAARFWARIFAINFAMGVVTGIPIEFQFGTNWAAFSKTAGGVIGQTLAMEEYSRSSSSRHFWASSSTAKSVSAPSSTWPPHFLFLAFVVVGILHHRDRCLDAASCWLHHGTQWRDSAPQLY